MLTSSRPVSSDETVRLEALYRLHILDTPPEERFDRLTRLAARTLGMPIALVSLSDQERQWFKSRYGLDVPEIPRSVAPCVLAIQHDELLVIEDALLDPRLATNPLVVDGPKIRFYAGQPLQTASGHKIGTLCVIDTQPRQLSENDRATLLDLALLVQSELNAVELNQLLHKQAQTESWLRESEARFRVMADTAPVFIWMSGPNGKNIFVNKGWLEFTGRRLEQELGEGYGESFHPLDRLRVWPVLMTSMESRQSFEFEMRLRRYDGVYRWMLARGVPRYTGDGEFVGFIGSCIDIDDRKVSEEVLARSEQQYRTLAHHFPGGAVFLFDRDLRYLVADGESLGLVGMSREQIEGRTLWEVLPPEIAAQLEFPYRAALDGETYRGKSSFGERIYDMQIVPVRNEQQEVFAAMCVVLDITEQHEAQEALKRSTEELRQAQKMEAIGRLAGGIAHDFNNILTAIMGCAEMALYQLEPTDPIHEDLVEILSSSQRAAALTSQLLTFSHRQVVRPRPLSLGELVQSTQKLLHRLIGEDIALTTSQAPGGDDTVLADAGQLEQVILNLAINSRDAMPDGGRLNIEVQSLKLEVAFTSSYQQIPAAQYVVLTVSDSGNGIAPHILSQIYEPFFTTKEIGKGTGLGLATVYAIVTQHKGYITVSSQVGVGTTFKVYLPRHSAALPALSPTIRPAYSRLAKVVSGPVILVVEDDDAVRQLTCRILQNHGYAVIEARRVSDALALCEANNYNFQLVLTDVVMPDMNGKQMVSLLKAAQPNLQVLYMSGYSEGIITRHGIVEGDVKLIQKPFSSHDLLSAIKGLLEADFS